MRDARRASTPTTVEMCTPGDTRKMYTVPPVARTIFSAQCAMSSFHPPSLLFPHGYISPRLPSTPQAPSTTSTPRASRASIYTAHASQGEQEIGRLANPSLLTGYEPKHDADNQEFTPIFPDIVDTQETEQDFTTETLSEDGQQHTSSSQHGVRFV